MKKIILVFFIIIVVTYADDGSVNKIKRLNNKLVELNQRFNKIKRNQQKYNLLISEYKKVSFKYQRLIDLCKKNECNNETIDLRKNFTKLKKSIVTLNDMMETDRASIRSLEKQKKVIESMIRMEKRVDTFPLQEEVKRTIDAM